MQGRRLVRHGLQKSGLNANPIWPGKWEGRVTTGPPFRRFSKTGEMIARL